ncbi:5923_t:CDS:2, partial [Entrophospora sp. SA101]
PDINVTNCSKSPSHTNSPFDALSAPSSPRSPQEVSLEDPCYKVLPSALKKYKVHDDWRKYALFICFGSQDNPVERCLSYDEKPLLLFQKLKEANQNPVFMLKNIKEIKSPVATAEEILNSLKANKSKRRTTQFLNKELPPPPPPAETYPLNTSKCFSKLGKSTLCNEITSL